eukprot:CAMPEP_0171071770 /NCGR_PEP_ID=MMETSP0766_2-20121228/10496_1 /TAXON_ID=439317 /ORGANISM="Gambierdiscus australes, Strain CAWD 149" /LENGTH=184 /DNA_ID=CAMNT_0011528321 /DNA_START=368 /DNA_END=923 /DNA_ORIENTATION=+
MADVAHREVEFNLLHGLRDFTLPGVGLAQALAARSAACAAAQCSAAVARGTAPRNGLGSSAHCGTNSGASAHRVPPALGPKQGDRPASGLAGGGAASRGSNPNSGASASSLMATLISGLGSGDLASRGSNPISGASASGRQAAGSSGSEATVMIGEEPCDVDGVRTRDSSCTECSNTFRSKLRL